VDAISNTVHPRVVARPTALRSPAPARVLPHRSLRDIARRHGERVLLRLGGLPVIVASSAYAAATVLRARTDLELATRPVTRMTLLAIPEGVIFAPAPMAAPGGRCGSSAPSSFSAPSASSCDTLGVKLYHDMYKM
jgi:hypothetical protein